MRKLVGVAATLAALNRATVSGELGDAAWLASQLDTLGFSPPAGREAEAHAALRKVLLASAAAPSIARATAGPSSRRLEEEPRGWSASNGQLTANLEVAKLRPDGALEIPSDLQLLLEIGSNTRNTLDKEILPAAPGTFVVTFEPLLDKWATLISRFSVPDHHTPLGHHHQRGVALPFAVTTEASSSLSTLKISGILDGCASLLDVQARYYSSHCTNVSGTLEKRQVPTLTLAQLLAAGGLLAGRDVALAKLDAQGLDVPILQAAGPLISHIRAVQVEVVRDRSTDRCTPQYSYPANPKIAHCRNTEAAMHEMGFEPLNTNCSVVQYREALGCEAQMMFVRRDAEWDRDLVLRFCEKQHSCKSKGQ